MRRNLLAVVFSAVSIAGMLFAATPEAQAAVGTTTTVSLSKPSIAYGAGANETITVVVTDASTAKPAGTVAITVPGITGTIPSITIGAGGTCSSTGTYQRTCTGTATVPAATAGGTYTVTATYTPTSNAFSGSFGTTSLTITPVAATAALGAQPNGTYGGTVTLSATNTGLSGGAAPTGVPTFTVNGTATGGTPACSASGAVETCTLSYQLPPALTPTNSYTDSVSFAADANYATSTASSTVTVGKATPVASIPGVSGGYQKNVTLTETNTGPGAAYAAPTGVPTVTVGTQNQNRAKACTEAEDVETCTALYTIRASQTVGTYALKVVFAADDNYNPSTGTGTFSDGDGRCLLDRGDGVAAEPAAGRDVYSERYGKEHDAQADAAYRDRDVHFRQHGAGKLQSDNGQEQFDMHYWHHQRERAGCGQGGHDHRDLSWCSQRDRRFDRHDYRHPGSGHCVYFGDAYFRNGANRQRFDVRRAVDEQRLHGFPVRAYAGGAEHVHFLDELRDERTGTGSRREELLRDRLYLHADHGNDADSDVERGGGRQDVLSVERWHLDGHRRGSGRRNAGHLGP